VLGIATALTVRGAQDVLEPIILHAGLLESLFCLWAAACRWDQTPYPQVTVTPQTLGVLVRHLGSFVDTVPDRFVERYDRALSKVPSAWWPTQS